METVLQFIRKPLTNSVNIGHAGTIFGKLLAALRNLCRLPIEIRYPNLL
jgi:hypothetical protein